jgi:hypothetical protein
MDWSINKKDLCNCGRAKDVRSKQCSYCFDNRPTKKYYCKCGKEIKKTTKYCWECHVKLITGKNNPNFGNKWTGKQKNYRVL